MGISDTEPGSTKEGVFNFKPGLYLSTLGLTKNVQNHMLIGVAYGLIGSPQIH